MFNRLNKLFYLLSLHWLIDWGPQPHYNAMFNRLNILFYLLSLHWLIDWSLTPFSTIVQPIGERRMTLVTVTFVKRRKECWPSWDLYSIPLD